MTFRPKMGEISKFESILSLKINYYFIILLFSQLSSIVEASSSQLEQLHSHVQT
jgi:hypothetical protein